MKCVNEDCTVVWWHATCAGFNKNVSKKDLEKIGAWTCPCCVVSKLEIGENGIDHSEVITKMDQKLDDLNGHIADLQKIKEDLSEISKLQTEGNKLWADVVKSGCPDLEKTNNMSQCFASSVAKEVISQSHHVLHDRENREKNIIIFNAQESDSSAVEERKVHDTELFDKLCNHVIGGRLSIDKITRIGKKISC